MAKRASLRPVASQGPRKNRKPDPFVEYEALVAELESKGFHSVRVSINPGVKTTASKVVQEILPLFRKLMKGDFFETAKPVRDLVL